MLAREMGMTAEELEHRMTYREFLEHLHAYHTEPWGDVRSDLHAALVACTMANTVPRKKGAKGFKMKDFVLSFGERKPVEQQITRWVDNMRKKGLVRET